MHVIDQAIDANERLDTLRPWSWPIMKSLETVLTSACSPLAAALFDRFHASQAVFAYASPDDGGAWLQVEHHGPAIADALAAYAAPLCVDPSALIASAWASLSIRVAPQRDTVSVAVAPDGATVRGCTTVLECFYRSFVLRHLAFMQGTLPPAGQGIVLTYGRDRMRIEHVHTTASPASGPETQCLWIDDVPASLRLSLG